MPRLIDRPNRMRAGALAGALGVLLAGCAHLPMPTATAAPAAARTPAPAAPTAAASAAAAAPSAARPPAPGTPAPFAEVTRDAKRADGFLPVWTKDDKTWLEIPADRLDRPFFLGHSIATGLGERFVLPGLMGTERVVVLRRVGQTVQLVARNLHARGPEGTPLARALAESYSDSLLASAPLAAAPHAQSQALLVDALALLGGDLASMQTYLETAFRLPYSLDRANSSIASTRPTAQGTSIGIRAHYAVPKLPAPPVVVPGGPPPNPAALPSPPRTVPDARSLFIGHSYTLAPLPARPMTPRRADQRVGYFTEGFVDFADDAGGDRRTHLINRWRLEKKDPAAEVSEPVEPIRVVMDRNIPPKWRDAVRAGILEWNRAFERAGWRHAIAVEQQPDDADWSTTEGTRMLAVRWFAMEGPGATAVGPSQADPRTGEILRGAAIIPENWVRIGRTRLIDTQPRLAGAEPAAHAGHAGHDSSCTYAHEALEQAGFAFDLLVARGAIDPKGPDAERFIADSLKDVVMHEVGHALGLRHNFRASAGVTRAQLRDPAFTAGRGISNSVMDYNALNLPLDGEASATVQMTTLGAYDYWAIEYGYRAFPPDREAAALAEIAGRSAQDPALAYATDEDAAGIDPNVNRFDLGDDPLAYAKRQIRLARELWQRTEARALPADDDLTLYRRNLQRVLGSYGAVVPLAVRHVGGTYTSRALAGAGQPLLAPVPAARQREALDLVIGEVFASTSFRFDPKVMSRLGVDQFDRSGGSTDFSLAPAVLAIQRNALDTLMTDALAARLADAELKVADRRGLPSYADVQQQLQRAIWSELKAGGREIEPLRRNLQREHLKRLAGGLLRPANAATADAAAVHRMLAQQLHGELKVALAGKGWSPIARAHLQDSLGTLAEALRAPLVRQGV